jgi:beta-lactamase regulating signal transducer with metallopeptidase domain
MNEGSAWAEFQLLVVLAIEAGLLSLILFMALRRSPSVAWRWTFCQAAVTGMLLLALSEISGAGHVLASRVASVRATVRSPVTLAATPTTLPKLQSEQGSPGEVGVAQSGTTLDSSQAPHPSVMRVVPTDPNPIDTSAYPSRLGTLVSAIWVLGLIVVAGRAVLARGLTHLFRARRKVVDDPAVLARVDRIVHILGLRRQVRVLASGQLISPFAFGLMRPTLGLPDDFAVRFNEAQQEAILAHEIAHLAGNHPFWCLVGDAASAMLWWHPAVWWVRRQLHLAGELAADEASLLASGSPCVLAQCLVEMGKEMIQPMGAGRFGIAGFRSHLGHRVQFLVELEGKNWSPPRGLHSAIVKGVGPLTAVAIVILCTAWVTPRQLTKGETMTMIKLNWKHSLTAAALLVANQLPTAATPTSDSERTSDSPTVTADLTPEKPDRVGAQSGKAPDQQTSATFSRKSGDLWNRSRAGSELELKLRSMIVPSVDFKHLPLSDVLSYLSEQTRKLDPAKKGMNFLINPNQAPGLGTFTVDPTTGLPAAEPVSDPGSVIINFNLPLHDITMLDLLDAITKVANQPIAYQLEDYAVVFGFKNSSQFQSQVNAQNLGVTQPMRAMTFRVNTNTLIAGLESTFGIKVDTTGNANTRSRNVQAALRELLTRLGIGGDPNKSIFYNELTGILMVKAAPSDIDVIEAAIRTLGDSTAAESGNGASARGVPPTKSQEYADIRTALSALRDQEEDLSTRFTATHPKVQSIKGQITELTRRMDALKTQYPDLAYPATASTPSKDDISIKR